MTVVVVGAEERHADVLLHRQVVVELEGLEGPGEPATDPGVRLETVDAVALQHDAPLVTGEARLQQAGI